MKTFVNEPPVDFSKPENARAAQAALAKVRSEFGREYELWIAGTRHKTGDLLVSVNPSKPSEIVGRHHKANAELATCAIEDAHAYFPEWSRTPVERRVELAASRRRADPRTQARVRRVAGVRSRQDLARSRSRSCRSHRFLRILRARRCSGSPRPSRWCSCRASATR